MFYELPIKCLFNFGRIQNLAKVYLKTKKAPEYGAFLIKLSGSYEIKLLLFQPLFLYPSVRK